MQMGEQIKDICTQKVRVVQGLYCIRFPLFVNCGSGASEMVIRRDFGLASGPYARPSSKS